MKILDWLRGKDEDDDKEKDEAWPEEEEELPGDEDDPTVYPLW